MAINAVAGATCVLLVGLLLRSLTRPIGGNTAD
jgi:hypothetical protein